MEEILKEYWGLLVPLLIMQFFKDPILNICMGLKFYLSKNFNQFDNVIVNGEDAIIVHIGFFKTVFRMSEKKTFYFVGNDRLKFLRLEKKERDYEIQKD